MYLSRVSKGRASPNGHWFFSISWSFSEKYCGRPPQVVRLYPMGNSGSATVLTTWITMNDPKNRWSWGVLNSKNLVYICIKPKTVWHVTQFRLPLCTIKTATVKEEKFGYSYSTNVQNVYRKSARKIHVAALNQFQSSHPGWFMHCESQYWNFMPFIVLSEILYTGIEKDKIRP